MRYLIDTDIASYYLRGKYDLSRIFQNKGLSNIRLSVITVAQMRVLAYKNPQSKINLAAISSFARLLGVLDVDVNAWEIFSKVKAEMETSGQPRGDLDILQASLAKQFELSVITHNLDHYKGIVDCEDWTKQ